MKSNIKALRLLLLVFAFSLLNSCIFKKKCQTCPSFSHAAKEVPASSTYQIPLSGVILCASR